MSSSTSPLLSPEEIAVRAGRNAPVLHLPLRAELFSERETRLRQRAAGHAMRDYLVLMADLAHAQHRLLQSYPDVALPGEAALLDAARAGQPPVPAAQWPRDPAWREGLHRLLDELLPRLTPGPAREAVEALRALDAASLEHQADCLLRELGSELTMAYTPFVAAALQAYWTHLVLATQEKRSTDRLAPFGRIDDAGACPCCGSLPVASVARIDPGFGGLRYLQCSLCSTQWHMVRIKCSRCESTKGIHYESLQAVDDHGSAARKSAVEAEACDDCGHYLKIVHKERDFEVEPVADDLATLTLDLLMGEAGFQRHGANLLLLFGEADGPGEPHDGAGG